jgi:lipopolysaccharide transport system ATP-binding protein
LAKTVIAAENLSKVYLLGHQAARRDTHFRDALARATGSILRKTIALIVGQPIVEGDEIEELWALKNVTFEAKQGEVLGIIGRNGAGKSTLLKILSRISEPSAGKVRINGRVASLLEVGTGFHPELTGRENIFLNGAILGMRRAEIRKRFDEIVAFAGVEKFLDTPVKRYSSGMYVRLAFSVAAHLEADILIVDEVLAVGDHEFQQKCLGKMRDVTNQQGRTVLLVSHNLAAISEMATRALFLSSGSIAVDDNASVAISKYLAIAQGVSAFRYEGTPRQSPHVSRAEVLTSGSNGVHQFGEPLKIQFQISHLNPMSRACFSFHIINQYQQAVVHAWALFPEHRFGALQGISTLTCSFPSLRLNVGKYHLRTHLTEPPGGEIYENVDALCSFEVVRTDKATPWGWRPDACVYHENWVWDIDQIIIGESRAPRM